MTFNVGFCQISSFFKHFIVLEYCQYTVSNNTLSYYFLLLASIWKDNLQKDIYLAMEYSFRRAIKMW